MIRKGVVNAVIEELEKIAYTSTMENAAFGSIDNKEVVIPANGVTAFIKEQTHLWRETWITGQLRLVIEELKAEVSRK